MLRIVLFFCCVCLQLVAGAKKEVALVQLSFDGITTYYSGVGTVLIQTQQLIEEMNQDMNQALNQALNQDPELSYHIKSYLVSAKGDPQFAYFSPAVLQKNATICRESGGELITLAHPLKGSPFATPSDWDILCKEGAEICAEIINQNEFTVVIAHDTTYAHVPLLLSQMNLHKPYRAVWVPHATGLLFQDTKVRQDWEFAAVAGAFSGSYSIGYTGLYFKEHLQSAPFLLPASSLVPYQLGIIRDPYAQEIPREQIVQELQARSIPLDKQLIFSLGRAVNWKGHDITLELYRHLKEQHPELHLVLLAPLTSMPKYFETLKNRISAEKLDVTLIPTFDTELARYLYQWEGTAIVSLLSRSEPLSLTVMEARVNPKNAIVLVSNVGGLGPQVHDGIDGFVCGIEELQEVITSPQPISKSMQLLIDKANKILALSSSERAYIIENGKKLIQEEYDLRKNLHDALLALFDQENMGTFAANHFQN